MKLWFKSGSPWIWMTAGAVSVSLISVIGLLLLIASRGLSYFWPADIHQFEITTQAGVSKTIIGEIYEKEHVPTQQLVESGVLFKETQGETVERFLIKTGNREYVDLDFQWLLTTYIEQQSTPTGLAVFERSKNGNFYGYLDSIVQDGKVVTENKNQLLAELIERAVGLNDKALDLQNGEIGAINYEFERLRLKQRKHELDGDLTEQVKSEIEAQRNALQTEYLSYEKELFEYRNLENVTVLSLKICVANWLLYN